tara:strand:- start:27 stop:302 length:276 start_codon:yes stop_codon:yes gene_type:complete
MEKKTPPKYNPWNNIPVKRDSVIFFFETIISFLLKYEKIKKPIATIKNLKASAENGSLLSTIGFVVINAEDQSRININGKSLIIQKKNIYF